MKWTYAIAPKIKTAFILATVFLLILGKNIWDDHNDSRLSHSFSSVYEDRLIVEGYILELSEQLYQKKLLLGQCQTPEEGLRHKEQIMAGNKRISRQIAAYEKTRLTPAESSYFDEFKNLMNQQALLETSCLSDNIDHSFTSCKEQLNRSLDESLACLRQLSLIQINEGKQMHDHSQQIIAGNATLSQIEIIFLIITGLMIQMLVLASRTLLPGQPQKAQMN